MDFSTDKHRDTGSDDANRVSSKNTWDDVRTPPRKIRFLLKIHTAVALTLGNSHTCPAKMPKESTQELRETRSAAVTDSSKRAREPKSSAADAAPASPLRLDTVTEDEAEQERPNAPARNTRRPNRNKRRSNMPAKMPINITQSSSFHQPSILPAANMRGRACYRAAHRRARGPEPEQTTVPEQTTEPVPEQTTIEPLETTTTEPEVTTSDPVQATTTEPAEPSEPEPAQPQPSSDALKAAPNAGPPLRRRRLPSSETEGGFASQAARLHPAQDASTGPRLSRAFTAAAGCWFNRCSQDASASGIRAFQNPTCSPCRVPPPHVQPRSPPRALLPRLQQWLRVGLPCLPEPTCSPGHRHEHDCHASSSGSGSGFRASQNAPHRHEFHVISPSHNFESSSASVVVEHRPPAPQSDLRLAIGDKVLKLTRQAFYERIFPKLLASWFPSTNHLNRGLIVPVHFFETMAEYRLSGAICVEMHKVLNRLGLTFGKILFSMTCGQSADIEKTYQFLTSRALMILVCLDSEAAFGVDRAVDGHMRLDELALWERTFPFYVRRFFMTVPCWNSLTTTENSSPRYSRLANVNTSLSEDERKTYDWSIQCHKFRTNTCYREIPAHWDCLFKFTGNA
ncbi:hypothetical protein PAPYR_13219 [Paratrimastix pyriformis]|uniref:Uncharacterized protein n=1 Tax=Paratrimastix pyriformis TaxID=342808 RepID=A0ABQ8U235_9EUKA|nr:hypothetical protein PAPYR_13219 [Paratrimastix pyriformis]